jgi:hypothetical protein
MELVHALMWEGFTMETLHDALRDKVRKKPQKEKNKEAYRYEGTAQIKERVIGYYDLEDFTL